MFVVADGVEATEVPINAANVVEESTVVAADEVGAIRSPTDAASAAMSRWSGRPTDGSNRVANFDTADGTEATGEPSS